MTKKILLFFISVLCLCSVSMAQSNDQEVIGEFTIKIVQNSDASYGYEIYKEGQLRIKQIRKIYLKVSTGFQNKNNAFVIARWEVDKLAQNKKESEVLDAEKAKLLGVTEEDLH